MIFTTTQYPFIDIKNGGSRQGEIAALNNILKTAVTFFPVGQCSRDRRIAQQRTETRYVIR